VQRKEEGKKDKGWKREENHGKDPLQNKNRDGLKT
jgi:hypothetical protein